MRFNISFYIEGFPEGTQWRDVDDAVRNALDRIVKYNIPPISYGIVDVQIHEEDKPLERRMDGTRFDGKEDQIGKEIKCPTCSHYNTSHFVGSRCHHCVDYNKFEEK
jgi:hypothetical protein